MTKWITLLQNNDLLGVKKYIKEGADINACLSETNESVMACALRFRCDNDLITLIRMNGADLEAIDNEGVSIFDNAITYNYPELVRIMVDSGVDVNKTRRKSGFTPLMAAVCYGRGEMVKLLMENGAKTHALDERNMSAFDYARKMQQSSISKILENES